MCDGVLVYQQRSREIEQRERPATRDLFVTMFEPQGHSHRSPQLPVHVMQVSEPEES